MVKSEAVRLEREKRKSARELRAWERERILWDRLLTPNVIRIALMCGIIAYSTHVTRSENKESPLASALAFALPGIGLPLLAADAGIRDKYALAAIAAAGLGYTGLSAAQGLSIKDHLESLIGTVPLIGPTAREWID